MIKTIVIIILSVTFFGVLFFILVRNALKRKLDILVEEEKKSLNEEKIKCPNCGHMNDADAHKCSNCGASLNSKSEDKDGKKKAMTGSPATKVDTTPEVEYDK